MKDHGFTTGSPVQLNENIAKPPATANRWRPLWQALLLLLLIVLIFWILVEYFIQMFQPLHQITIYNNQWLNEEQIIDQLALDETTTFWDVSAYQLSYDLIQLPWISSARVLKKPPNQLEIWVEERNPVAKANIEDRIFWIDKNRILLDPQTSEFVDLPNIVLITGDADIYEGVQIQSSNLKQAFKLLDLTKEHSFFQQNPVHTVVLKNLTSIRYLMQGSIVIDWGKGDFQQKIQNLNYALPKLLTFKSRLRKIDLRYQNRVVFNIR